MSTLDRDKAREVLRGYAWGSPEEDATLDALEACVVPVTLDRDKARDVLWAYLRMNSEVRDDEHFFDLLEACIVPDAIEGRDWIRNPDGTLVYWQREAEDARARVAAALALHQPDEAGFCDECTRVALGPEPWPCATAQTLGVEAS